MNELALFAGTGGGILGGKLLGWRTVCAVERDAYAAAVLAQRQNDGCLEAFPIWSDVETFDGKPWRGIVDVVSGGFPCTDISCAGKGAGIEGDESGLWREFARIIGEVRPRYALVENSPMLTVRGLGTVLGDLAAMGYDATFGVISAADAIWIGSLASGDLPVLDHLRERIWIIGVGASSDSTSPQSDDAREGDNRARRTTIGLGGIRPTSADPQINDAGGLSIGAKSEHSGLGFVCENNTRTDRAIGGLAMRWWTSGRSRHPDQFREDAHAAGEQDDGIGRDSERRRDAVGWDQQAAQRDDGPADNDSPCRCGAKVSNTASIGDTETKQPRQGNVVEPVCAEDADLKGKRLGKEGQYRLDKSEKRTPSGSKENDNADESQRQGDERQERGREEHADISRVDWWLTERGLGRVANGTPHRVDRLKAIGNGQVPSVVALAWEILSREL